MLLNILHYLATNLLFFTGSYSNNVFPEQLPEKEELEYIKRAKKGDMESRNKLIEHNLRLVAHIVKKFESTNHDTDDLIGIGTVGLIKGIDTYSENKKVKLATYAAMLNKNVESILDCRSLSLQAHASSNESARSASYYLGISRIITTTISVVASMIIESANALSVDNYNEQENDRISTYKATSIIRSSISDLDKIRIHKL